MTRLDHPAQGLLPLLAALGERLRSAAPPGPPAPLPGGIDLAFGLTRFEAEVLLLCAGMELDPAFHAQVAALDGGANAPTVAFALAHLAEPDWSSFAPSAPLRYWRLIELHPGPGLAQSRLRLDETVLHALLGTPVLDERLMPLLRPLDAALPLAPSHEAVAAEIAPLLAAATPPLVQLVGPAGAGQAEIAAAAAARLGLALECLPARNLPASVEAREELALRWRRHALLTDAALLLAEDGDEEPRALAGFLAALAIGGAMPCPVIVATSQPLPTPPGLAAAKLDIARPRPVEQAALWHDALGPLAPTLADGIAETAARYEFGPGAIRAIAAQAPPDGPALRRACRRHLRHALDDLATRIAPRATFADLVVPPPIEAQLRLILAQARGRLRVLDEWGFGTRYARGLGIGALFAGPSGTGKSLTAEVLAGALELDLFRVDLSRVVSKYIGETERNLRRVFDAAEAGQAVLLFDEADALFGKRTEVKDSHDRYANIEVSYLLSRMEEHRGLAILTTNMREAIDVAFLRRLRFVVEFPFPDAAERARIWARMFPPEAPTHQLDMARLAQLNLPGGHIRNIALGAAYLAADGNAAIGMAHLRTAALAEFAKLERPPTQAELAGW
jgi:hypothetical protein